MVQVMEVRVTEAAGRHLHEGIAGSRNRARYLLHDERTTRAVKDRRSHGAQSSPALPDRGPLLEECPEPFLRPLQPHEFVKVRALGVG